jgi:2-octaprenyl-6-methoxyphenol hydroxylase
MTDYDILIIGGGLVGASLAVALARSGLRIGVVESRPWPPPSAPAYDDRTLALAQGSRRIFEAMGLWPAITEQAGATPIRRIHISDRGHFGMARLDAADAGIEALGYVVETPGLGGVLYRALQPVAALELIAPATMESLSFTKDMAHVQVKHDGNGRTITARLVIGADGGRSRVREAVAIGAHTKDYGQTAVVANVTPEQAHDGIAYERFTETGPLALLPMRDNRCTVVWSVRHAQARAMLAWDDLVFLQQLQARFGDRLGQFRRTGKRQAYPLSLTRVDTHMRARVVLIGNAAHTVHPVAGQGFNLGLRDVAVLSQVLVEALRAGRDIGELGVLAQYARSRRRDTQVVSSFTDGLIRIFANSSPPLALARDIGLLVADLLPPLKRALIRRTSGLAGPLPRFARGLSLTIRDS